MHKTFAILRVNIHRDYFLNITSSHTPDIYFFVLQVIDLPLNNTQYIILPNVSGGRTKGRYITHKLLQVEEPLARIDELGRGSRNYLNALGMQIT